MSLCYTRYARCEIVKVFSVLDMIDTIAKELVELEYLDASMVGKRVFKHSPTLVELELKKRAETIAQIRTYPAHLANRVIERI